MENTTANLRTSTDRVLKTDSQRGRSLSQERKQFIEEEYDFLCNEISAWLSQLVGKEISSDLVNELMDGTVLCTIVKECIPSISIPKFYENAEKTSFYAKDNIAIFSRACQEMGINKNDCLNPIMFENGDRKQIVNCLLHFALKGIQYGLKPIDLIHSERLQDFIKAMPEDIVSSMKEIAEKEVEEKKEEKSTEEKPAEEEHVWDRQDDINVCTLILIMFITLAGMFYLVYLLEKENQ